MGVFDWLFPNPAEKGREPLQKIPGTIKPYYEPFIGAGTQMLPELQSRYGEMMRDPGEIIKRLGAGYKQSPGFDWRMQQGQQAATNAAAAGGMAGTPQHQQQAAQIAEDIATQDYDKYMDRVTRILGQALSGGEDITKWGLGASGDLATNLAQELMSESNLEYAGQANVNKMTGNLINGILAYLSGNSGGGGSGGAAAGAAKVAAGA